MKTGRGNFKRGIFWLCVLILWMDARIGEGACEVPLIQDEYSSRSMTVPPDSSFSSTARSTYFSSAEINRNGWHSYYVFNPTFWSKMDGVRQAVGTPINISNGYRCPDKNASVGGQTNSLHQYGKAADIAKVNGVAWSNMSPSAKQNVKDQATSQGLRPVDEGDHLHVQLSE